MTTAIYRVGDELLEAPSEDELAEAGERLLRDHVVGEGLVDGRPIGNVEMYAVICYRRSWLGVFERWKREFLEFIGGQDGDENGAR